MSFVGGKLKLKGGADVSGVKKKKKKKQPTEIIASEADVAKKIVADSAAAAQEGAPPSSEEGDPSSAPAGEDRRTEAEKRFEAHLAKYEEARLKKAATKSHRERVKEMNEKLSTLTEHHDLPRISYSYM